MDTWTQRYLQFRRGAELATRPMPTLVPVSVARSSQESPCSIEFEIRRAQAVVQIRGPKGGHVRERLRLAVGRQKGMI